LWKFFEMYPTASDVSEASEKILEDLLQPIGLSKRRAKTLVRMSKEYQVKNWSEPIELYGIGKYANDAWKIFCTKGWKTAKPKDHALVWYHDWLLENYG